eukprot:CAMPEP_0177228684 /NCGR_PEP_ID=MMETSP0367-20130122/41285_1 /TAXON_ID=447022 ORGANISM="Scrippsiella hangoei-like, Strain SHHI-4" /NCGR_SAMPLE_ID=MMETSP0367 /ASSEMBLY_ACC=CAM_ASM_000362 /LENGTH=350 /DNA_ID=CAMNT_0018679009 /DNA_START=10 /DNA_END=1062 /DNA_ORIENTATION=+
MSPKRVASRHLRSAANKREDSMSEPIAASADVAGLKLKRKKGKANTLKGDEAAAKLPVKKRKGKTSKGGRESGDVKSIGVPVPAAVGEAVSASKRVAGKGVKRKAAADIAERDVADLPAKMVEKKRKGRLKSANVADYPAGGAQLVSLVAAHIVGLGENEVETEQTLREDKHRAMRLMGEILASADDDVEISEDDLKPVARKAVGSIQERKVFVGGLPFRADPDAVEDFFEKFGDIDSFNMPTDKDTGNGKGIAFIVYTQQESVSRAVLFDGQKYNGQKIRVKLADPDAIGKGSNPVANQQNALNDGKGTSILFSQGQGKGKGKRKGTLFSSSMASGDKGRSRGKGTGKK